MGEAKPSMRMIYPIYFCSQPVTNLISDNVNPNSLFDIYNCLVPLRFYFYVLTRKSTTLQISDTQNLFIYSWKKP